jgi:hypothetical protein
MRAGPSTCRLGIVAGDPEPGAAAIFEMTRNEWIGLHGSVRRVRGHPMIFPAFQRLMPRQQRFGDDRRGWRDRHRSTLLRWA